MSGTGRERQPQIHRKSRADRHTHTHAHNEEDGGRGEGGGASEESALIDWVDVAAVTHRMPEGARRTRVPHKQVLEVAHLQKRREQRGLNTDTLERTSHTLRTNTQTHAHTPHLQTLARQSPHLRRRG